MYSTSQGERTVPCQGLTNSRLDKEWLVRRMSMNRMLRELGGHRKKRVGYQARGNRNGETAQSRYNASEVNGPFGEIVEKCLYLLQPEILGHVSNSRVVFRRQKCRSQMR